MIWMRRFCGILGVILIAVGCVWVAINYHTIPLYGDTGEYVALSKTLKVDQYRGIVYPLLIRISNCFALAVGVKGGFTSVLYALQLALLFVSSAVFCMVLYRKFTDDKLINWRVIVCAFIASCNPLSMHFALSVLADSISASLVLLQAACLINAADRKLSIERFSIYLVVAGGITMLLSNLRIDKTYLSAIVFFILGIWLFFDPVKYVRIKKIAVSLIISVVTFIFIIFVRSVVTVPNPDRPDLSISAQLFNRAVWPRLSKTLPYLPPPIQNTITVQAAQNFDSHNNHVFPFQVMALRDPEKGEKYLNAITLTSIQHFLPDIFIASLFDFGKYLVPGVTFPLEMANVLPQSVATSWTVSRASMSFPKFTAVYLWIGSFLYFLVIILSIFCFRRIGSLLKGNFGIIAVIGVYLVGNSALFTLAFGMDAHIRYALPTYMLTLNSLLVFNISPVSK